jgi:hypothetical protein
MPYSFTVDGLKIRIHPQAYFSLNKTNMIAFEEQQILRSLAGLEDNPEEAKAKFDQHLAKVIELNISASKQHQIDRN